jgi:hypothetical protein
MADLFGIVGVIGFVTQLTQFGVEFGLDWKYAPSDVKSFIAELQTLQVVLLETNTKIIHNPDSAHAFRGRLSILRSQVGTAAQNTDTS